MKRYHFSLEPVLRARRAQEEAARQSLAAANHHLRRAQSRRDAALDAYRIVTSSALRGPGDRDAFFDERSRQLRLAEAVEEASKLVVQCEEETESCYSAWVLAGQRVASLERLDERRRSEWSYSEARAEAASVDDIVNARWDRQPSSGVRPK